MIKERLQKNILNIITLSVICASLLLLQGLYVALAADNKEKTTEEEKKAVIEDKNDDLKKLEKKEKKYRNIINLKQKEQDIINAQVKKLESESHKVQKTIEENEAEIKDLSNEIDRTKKEIEQKEGHISLQKTVLSQFLREKYQNYSKDTEYFTLLNIANNKSTSHRDNISHATDSVGRFVKTIHTEQQKLKEDQEKLEDKSKRIEDAKHELEERNDYIEGSKNYKRVLASQVNVEEGKYQTKLSKVLEEQLAIQQEISNLSTNQIGTFSLSDLPSRSEADFELPIKKPFVITQGYGKTSFSSHYKGGVHNGIDYVAQGSQSILAVADGKVKATGNMGRYGYGKWIAIDHGNGLVTLYGHFSSIKVDKGEKVKQGETIGKMGSTGFSTGPHLHFSVFAKTTFAVVESSSVSGVYIPTGATVNPSMYL